MDTERFSGVYDSLHGVTALMFSENAKEPAMLISSFRKETNTEKPVLKAAYIDYCHLCWQRPVGNAEKPEKQAGPYWRNHWIVTIACQKCYQRLKCRQQTCRHHQSTGRQGSCGSRINLSVACYSVPVNGILQQATTNTCLKPER